MPTLPVCLTIAGSDSGGGAGIQADLKSFHANGVFGASVITSITAQNTVAVTDVFDLPVSVIRSQLEAVWSDFEIAAVKTGMLSSAEIVREVAAFLSKAASPAPAALQSEPRGPLQPQPENDPPRLVVDPVMVSESGHTLLSSDAVDVVRTELLPLAWLITPNKEEAELLSGSKIESASDYDDVANTLLDMGPQYVLLKGGHLPEDEAADYLYSFDNHDNDNNDDIDDIDNLDHDNNNDKRDPAHNARIATCLRRYVTPRWDSGSTHGTGCTYASAIAAGLGKGLSTTDAIEQAKAYISGAIRHGLDIGNGAGPTDHFWFLREGRS